MSLDEPEFTFNGIPLTGSGWTVEAALLTAGQIGPIWGFLLDDLDDGIPGPLTIVLDTRSAVAILDDVDLIILPVPGTCSRPGCAVCGGPDGRRDTDDAWTPDMAGGMTIDELLDIQAELKPRRKRP